MTDNLLKLNSDKTELLISVNKHKQQPSQAKNDVNIGGELITPSASIRNLGAYFNIPMDHADFISNKCKVAWYTLHNIKRVRSLLTREACETIINLYVTSKLDYCNCLLYGVPAKMLERLQKVQNSAAKTIARVPRRDHVTPILADLHWLPIKQRVEYKILLYTYKALHDEAPDYLSELLNPYSPGRPLRSGDKPQGTRLQPPVKANYVYYGERAFVHAAPTLWNSLDISVKDAPTTATFKRRLKTFLYNQAYF